MAKELPEFTEVTLSCGKKIKVRRPKLRDIRAHFNEQNMDERQVLITMSLCQLSTDEMDDLPFSDFQKLSETTQSFL